MNNLKLLAVDDELVSRSFLERKLKNAGYDIESAENGNEAIDLISKSYFDVVITDLIMPGDVDGIGVLEAAKANYSGKTEVILITAHASVDSAVEAMKKGASDYLQKPINFDELMFRLEKIGNVKALVKNAGDLREAMDVTEMNAAQTIQDLEIKVFQLQNKLYEINKVLSDYDIDASERVRIALGI